MKSYRHVAWIQFILYFVKNIHDKFYEKFSCTFKLFPEGWECNIHEYCCYINDYNNVVLTEDSCQHHLSMYTMLYTSSSSSDVDNSIREVTTV